MIKLNTMKTYILLLNILFIVLSSKCQNVDDFTKNTQIIVIEDPCHPQVSSTDLSFNVNTFSDGILVYYPNGDAILTSLSKSNRYNNIYHIRLRNKITNVKYNNTLSLKYCKNHSYGFKYQEIRGFIENRKQYLSIIPSQSSVLIGFGPRHNNIEFRIKVLDNDNQINDIIIRGKFEYNNAKDKQFMSNDIIKYTDINKLEWKCVPFLVNLYNFQAL